MSSRYRFKSPMEDSNHTLEYVKSNLIHMGKIEGFKVYFNEENKEYFENVDGLNYYYNLILFDDNDNEFWLNSNCGYSGTGPCTTIEILELVGLRENYNIFKNKKIEEVNLTPNYDLEVLVVENDFLKDEYKIDFVLKLNFDNAENRYKLIESLKVLGDMQRLCEDDDRFSKYFTMNENYKREYIGEYGLNQVYFLDEVLRNKNLKELKELIEHICNKHTNMVEIISINSLVKNI